MKRLIAGVAIAALVFIPLSLYVNSEVSPTTPGVALLSGVTFAALAGTMIASTRGWSLRAVGLFLMLTGAAVLLLGIGADTIQPLTAQSQERALDVVMALWLVGGPLSLLGVVLYWLGGDRPPPDLPPDEPP